MVMWRGPPGGCTGHCGESRDASGESSICRFSWSFRRFYVFLCSFKTVPVGLKETLDSVNSGS